MVIELTKGGTDQLVAIQATKVVIDAVDDLPALLPVLERQLVPLHELFEHEQADVEERSVGRCGHVD